MHYSGKPGGGEWWFAVFRRGYRMKIGSLPEALIPQPLLPQGEGVNSERIVPISLSLRAMHYPHLEGKSRETTPHPRPLSHASGERGVGRFD